MDEAEIKVTLAKIKDAYWNQRLIDEDLICAVRSPEMMNVLFERLGSEDAAVYTEAAFALAEIAGESAKARLIECLASDRWQVRSAAAEGLGHYDDFKLTRHLIPLLNDPHPKVRMAVARTLESLRDPSAVPDLIEAIKDPDRHIYVYAVYALYEIVNEYEIPELFPYLKSDDVRMRVAAAYVLGAKGGKDAARGLIDLVRVGISGNQQEFEHALEHLLLIEGPIIDELIAVFDEYDPLLCQLVTPVLVKVGDQRALPHLIAAMGAEVDEVCDAATWGASQFGKAAIPFLLEAIKSENPRQRKYAARVLGRIQDASVVDDLVMLLNDSDMKVRLAALSALEDIGDVRAVEYIIPLLLGQEQNLDDEWLTASYAAQVLRGKLATPEGLEAVERWEREEGGNGV
ncbi:MAG: HEAT repeat domain-containing protein [Anaerolineae bacterium]|nr:HEAT repeat domain-containing protein [Anaerolineae bacterium]